VATTLLVYLWAEVPGYAIAMDNDEGVDERMPIVKVRENEPFEVALRRFKRSCEKAGVLSEIRRREYYEKPTQVRKRKQAAAVKRHMKRLNREQQRRQRPY